MQRSTTFILALIAAWCATGASLTHVIVMDDVIKNCTCATAALDDLMVPKSEYARLIGDRGSCACRKASEAQIAADARAAARNASRHWIKRARSVVALCVGKDESDLTKLADMVANAQFSTLLLHDCEFAVAADSDRVVTVYGLQQIVWYNTTWNSTLPLAGRWTVGGGGETKYRDNNIAFVHVEALASEATVKCFSYESGEERGGLGEALSNAARYGRGVLNDFAHQFLVSVVYAEPTV